MPITARSKGGIFKQVMHEWKKGMSSHMRSKKQALAVAHSICRRKGKCKSRTTD